MQIPAFCIKVNSIAFFGGKAHHSGIMGTAAAPTKRQQRDFSAKARGKLAEKRPAARRTTVTLSPETLEIVERFQQATGLSMSEAVSELIERTEPRPPKVKYEDGFPTADIPMDGDWITTEDILRAQAELG
ncbi:MAG: hypothetical protein ABR898_17495 [Terracidiphilus sp.]|jgi:hypothetical protein